VELVVVVSRAGRPGTVAPTPAGLDSRWNALRRRSLVCSAGARGPPRSAEPAVVRQVSGFHRVFHQVCRLEPWLVHPPQLRRPSRGHVRSSAARTRPTTTTCCPSCVGLAWAEGLRARRPRTAAAAPTNHPRQALTLHPLIHRIILILLPNGPGARRVTPAHRLLATTRQLRAAVLPLRPGAVFILLPASLASFQQQGPPESRVVGSSTSVRAQNQLVDDWGRSRASPLGVALVPAGDEFRPRRFRPSPVSRGTAESSRGGRRLAFAASIPVKCPSRPNPVTSVGPYSGLQRRWLAARV